MHSLKNILLLFMLRKTTLWQTYLPNICSPVSSILSSLLKIRRSQAAISYQWRECDIDMCCFQSKAMKKPRWNSSALSYLWWVLRNAVAWVFQVGQPEGGDEAGLWRDNAGLGPLTALQEHKMQRRNQLLSCQTPEHLDSFCIMIKLIKYFLI